MTYCHDCGEYIELRDGIWEATGLQYPWADNPDERRHCDRSADGEHHPHRA